MRQVIVTAPWHAVIEEIPTPDISSSQFFVEALITGVSAGTERMWFDGSNPAIMSGRRKYPYHPGYEFVGRVVAVGSEVRRLKVGDRIFAMKPHASHVVIENGDYWHKLPDDVSDENALAIALTATNLHAIHRSQMQVGDIAAVIGLGTVGMLCCQALRCAGAGMVIAVGRSEWKRRLALSLGADAAFSPEDPDLERLVTNATGERGVDVAFECAGTNAAIMTTVSMVRSQGRIAIIGFHTSPLSVSGEHLFAKELSIFGVRSAGNIDEVTEYNRWNRKEYIRLAAQLVCSGQVVMDGLITHRFPAGGVAQAYDLIGGRSPDYLQVVLDWT